MARRARRGTRAGSPTTGGASLDALTAAWAKEEAWRGSTHIAGFEAPAENIGMAAVNELVVHGWDVARASGQTLQVDAATMEPCTAFAAILAGPQGDALRGVAFGPEVPVGADASALDRVLGANGRDPGWTGRTTR